MYKINPDGLGEFEVYCDQKTAGGGWTVFQKRQDGSVDFYRPWDDYKRGFGNLNGEFWLGLDKIHRLTVSGSYKLRVDVEDLHGSTAFAEYSSFAVTSERAKYQLSLRSYSGKSWNQHYHTGWRSGESTRSHQCGPGSNPGVDAICGLSLLLVLPLATKVFFLQVLQFFLLFKNQHLISIRSGAHVHVFKNKLLFYNYSFLSSYKFTITITSLRQQQYIELTTLLKSCKAR